VSKDQQKRESVVMKYCAFVFVLALSLAATTGIFPKTLHIVSKHAKNDAPCELESVDAMPETVLPPAEPLSVAKIPERELAIALVWKLLCEVVPWFTLACFGLSPGPLSGVRLIIILILLLLE
jgi:hypothetical protein